MTEPTDVTQYAQDVVAAAASGVEAVMNAWIVAGPSVAAQLKAKRDLYESWPTLWCALTRMEDEKLNELLDK